MKYATGLLVFFFFIVFCSCGPESDKTIEKNDSAAFEKDRKTKVEAVIIPLALNTVPVKLSPGICDDCYDKTFDFYSVNSKDSLDAIDSILIPFAKEKYLWECIFRKTKYIAETKQKDVDGAIFNLTKKSLAFSDAEKKKLEVLYSKIDSMRNDFLASCIQSREVKDDKEIIKLRKKTLDKLLNEYCSVVYHIWICACDPDNWPDHYMEGLYKTMNSRISKFDYKKFSEKLTEKQKNKREEKRLTAQMEKLKLIPYSKIVY
ncbi:MAG: hypothetical protein IAF38_01105 [Bacteroidia bacterium]|nr:hypothetical protein [Bacteroidia bacterium]